MAPPISQRGQKALGDIIDYAPFVWQAWENPYSADNPEGKILLAVAENKAAYPILAPKLREAAAAAVDDEGVANYGPTRGRPDFQESIARFLTKHLTGGVPIAAEHVSALCGVGALLDLVSHVLFDAGDVVLIPAPYYAAFDNDLVVRAGVRIQPVTTSPPNWELTAEAFDEAETKAGGKVAGVLLTNPHNPLGVTLSRDIVQMVHAWCAKREAHLICDELYGSIIFGGEEGEKSTKKHVSIAQVCPDGRLGDRNHLVWGFSKDFGISGFRVGILVSENEQLNQALNNVALFSNLPGHTQAMLRRVLDDESFIEKLIASNCDSLRRAYTVCTTRLRALSIPFVAAEAGMFIMIDLRAYLKEPTADAEKAAMQEMFESNGIVLTPGLSLHCPDPGWFRICYAFVELSILEVAFDRLAVFVGKHRKSSDDSKL